MPMPPPVRAEVDDRLRRWLRSALVRAIAASQAMPAIVLQGAWVLLALATWAHADGGDGAVTTLTRTLLSAYRWLGGVDESGHGDGDGLVAVAGKLALVLVALDALWRWLRGEPAPRPPRPLWQPALLAGGVAAAGFLFALWPTRAEAGAALVALPATFAAMAAVATAWALAVRRYADRLLAAPITPPPPAPRDGLGA